jgi:uncharacterized protein
VTVIGADDALQRLMDVLRGYPGLVTAYSGGADSALVAWTAHHVHGPAALAVTAVSASLPAAERAAAKRFAGEHGLAHVEVCTDEVERPAYRANGGDRCWHCKSALMDALLPLAELLQRPVALGTNSDDLGDHRPGQRAAAGRGAVAPLLEAGFDKATVRAVSARLGLATADKPAAACLASRIAYGDPVDAAALAQVERAEETLHELGFASVRVRSHAGGTVARVEVPASHLDDALARREAVAAACRHAGFTFATLDLAGLRSGSLNLLLPAGRRAR